MYSVSKSTAPRATAVGRSCLAPQQVFLVENHDGAYHLWRRAGISDRILVHVDAHHDMWQAPDYESITVANFVSLALKDRIAREVFWVVPDATWNSLSGITAVNQHIRRLAEQYSSQARPRLSRDRIDLSLAGTNLTICSVNSLPRIATPVLLDIDVDFFVIDRVSYGKRDIPLGLPWCWPNEFLEGLSADGLRSDFVTIAYSVEGEYTPLKWKYLGDELALRLQPTPDPKLLQGMVCIRQGAVAASQGDQKDAEAAYCEAMRLLPQSFTPPLHLAYVYANAGRLDKAQEMYRRALDLDGGAELRRSYGFGDYWCGRYAEAEREFRLMNALDPANPFAWLGLGLIEARSANWAHALTLLNRAAELNPDSLDAHRALAGVLAKQKRNKDAITAYERSLKLAVRGCRPLKALPITNLPTNVLLDPDHWRTFARLARLYELEMDSARAIQAYRFSIAGGKEVASIRWRLALLYFRTNCWQTGLRESFHAIDASVFALLRHVRRFVDRAAATLGACLSLVRAK